MYNRREKNLYYIVILFERSVFYSIPTMVKRPIPYSAFNNSVPLKIVKFIEKNKKKNTRNPSKPFRIPRPRNPPIRYGHLFYLFILFILFIY
jgi:hypothetical protein